MGGSAVTSGTHTTYEEYYGFTHSPFTLSPDPQFLFLSESHAEALQLLRESVRRREGFIVLTGDVGTGKTTLGRALLGQLDRTCFSSLVLNPFLSVDELLREVLLDFGVVSRDDVHSGRIAAASTHDLTSALHQFLLSLVPIGGTAVLVIDEAQHLLPAVLEHIRVISNLETHKARLLQIVLIGQTSLLETLERADLRQLASRVSLRATLRPLTRDEIEAYVEHRLRVAHGVQPPRFDASSHDALVALTGGVPRAINLVCDRALMLGAQLGTLDITGDMVRAAGRALGLTPAVDPAEAAARDRRLWTAAAAVLAVLVVATLTLAPLHRVIDAPLPPLPLAPPRAVSPMLMPRPVPGDADVAPLFAPRPRPRPSPIF